MKPVLVLVAAALAVPVFAVGAASAVAAPPAVEITPGPARDAVTFDVKYTGASKTETTYRGKPSNPTGGPDLNTAHDRSATSWAMTFPAGLAVPSCTVAADDPCTAVTGVGGARGKTAASGTIDHRHVDGIYDQLDAVSKCSVKARAVPRQGLAARIDVTYDAVQASFVVTAKNPISEALTYLPAACREPVDGIDRILGNYFMPGFSFSPDYGADRWFTSASVAIPVAQWHASTRIRLRLGLTTAGKAPGDCAARFTYERCRTSGSWSGVLTFTARPASA